VTIIEIVGKDGDLLAVHIHAISDEYVRSPTTKERGLYFYTLSKFSQHLSCYVHAATFHRVQSTVVRDRLVVEILKLFACLESVFLQFATFRYCEALSN
jgi:hypothetical protein